MGVVHAAYDPELDRKIALKLLNPRSGDGQEAEARLIREAQAIARLSHPNVVAVYDVGSFEGRVFMAMELVEGQTLQRWLHEEQRGWRDILHVLVAAGRGLAAAHAVDLVHRDFKPNNVLIGDDGRVRVLDFGLARVAGEPSGSSSGLSPASSGTRFGSSITQTGTVMGTPAYMAPEQHAGLAADARADQFSFCVLAYEALYGQRPFAGDDADSVANAIIEGQIRPPPSGTTVPGWIRRIIVRGLSGRPEDRYRNMPALLAELDRDPGARRRRTVIAVVAIVTVAAAGVGLNEVRRGRAQVCAGASDKLASVWDDASKSQIRRAFEKTERPYALRAYESVERIVDGWAQSWTEVHTNACESTRIQREQSEDMLDLQMACLDQERAELRALVDLLREADAKLVERSVTAVSRLPNPDWCTRLSALRATYPPPSEALAQRAADIREQISRSRALGRAGKYEEGLAVVRTATATARELAYRPVLAEALVELGNREWRTGDLEGAEASLDEALRVAEEARHDRAKASALYQLTWLLGYKQARYAEALRLARLGQAALARYGGDADLQSSLLGALGVAYDESGDPREAIQYHEQALEIARSHHGENSPAMATALENLAISQKHNGDLESATKTQERVLKIREDVLGPDHPAVAYSYTNLASAAMTKGEWKRGLELQQKALDILARTVGPMHEINIAPMSNVAIALNQLGRHDEAIATLQRALEIADATIGADHPAAAVARGTLGDALLSAGKIMEAQTELERALRDLERTAGPGNLKTASVLLSLGRLWLAENRPNDALPHLERALKIYEAHRGAAPANHIDAAFALARALWDIGDQKDRARELAQQALALGPDAASTLQPQIEAWLGERQSPRGRP
jgi:tetratricopeptide (TPR) repeat protein